ncbi:hypothetical protein TNIN_362291 [Trichonephila inaurata madagascariensis]|uniref:Uncharacterized protein n=1 Tax=Trichonephila inaurata madagascariensis TaxID=2747483 RepID=A0A8X6XIL4_9ARAC|nr:hypothetical protein TNIN_362291 [Trichonephila inaurata madagascariensis]
MSTGSLPADSFYSGLEIPNSPAFSKALQCLSFSTRRRVLQGLFWLFRTQRSSSPFLVKAVLRTRRCAFSALDIHFFLPTKLSRTPQMLNALSTRGSANYARCGKRIFHIRMLN